MNPVATRLARRIIPCLDVRAGRVVKGVRFRDHRQVGDILPLAERYRDQGADELVFYDITASPDGRRVDPSWVERVARVIDIPFCVAGGIDSVAAARRVLNAGADKISVNSPALARPELISELAAAFGRQCVVVGVDSRRNGDALEVHALTGSSATSRQTGRSTLDWLRAVQDLGAGEIVLNCMDSDGVRKGYDIDQLGRARAELDIPLIASGGAGTTQHFETVFRLADVDGALAASVFHSGALAIPTLKAELQSSGIRVRS